MADTREIITENAKETAEVGERLALERPRIICLYGELGSGKTVFAQGYAKGLGLQNRLPSPTFIIVRRYQLPNECFFYHFDLYRTQNVRDIEGLGISEIFSDPNAFVLIEWAERLGNLVPKQRTDIMFSVLDNGKHKITFK